MICENYSIAYVLAMPYRLSWCFFSTVRICLNTFSCSFPTFFLSLSISPLFLSFLFFLSFCQTSSQCSFTVNIKPLFLTLFLCLIFTAEIYSWYKFLFQHFLFKTFRQVFTRLFLIWKSYNISHMICENYSIAYVLALPYRQSVDVFSYSTHLPEFI